MLTLQGILFGTFPVVLVGNFPKSTKFWSLQRPVGSYYPFLSFFKSDSSFVKVIQQLNHQRQHFEPPLKIAEKMDTFFTMALCFCPIL
jgi:hypothetical protein